MAKTFAFFKTIRGQQFTYGCFCVGSVSLISVNFFPHTLALSKYKEMMHSYKSGIERVLPDKIKHRMQKACDLLQLSQNDRNMITPFSVIGFDLFRAGTTKSRFGAIVGIPINYTYGSDAEIDRSDVKLYNENIQWGSEAGKLLAESLVLSEDEQIFGIAKTILEVRTAQVPLNCVYPIISLLTTYGICHSINQKLGLLQRPFSLRGVMYTIVGLFGYGLWAFLTDFTNVRLETNADKSLCALGPDVVESGVRFYDKLLKKNMALRGLTNENTYSARGNENFLIRQKRLPLTIRKSYFEMRLAELKENTAK